MKNTGSREGDEVPQLHLEGPVSAIARPVMELRGFRRVHLGGGESPELRFTLTPEMLMMLDEGLKQFTPPGEYRIMIGCSSADIRLRGVVSMR